MPFTFENICLPKVSTHKTLFNLSKKPKNISNPDLKNLLADLMFLSREPRAWSKDYTVVCVGSTSRHYAKLASLFPYTEFLLYHPNPYKISSSPNIRYMGQYFTNDEAICINRDNLIFLGDVHMMTATCEEEVELSMACQMTWTKILKPVIWSMNCRIPLSKVKANKSYTYLPGRLVFLPYNNPLSAEMRLEGRIPSSQTSMYNARAIDQIMYHHNTVTRPTTDFDRQYLNLAVKVYNSLVDAKGDLTADQLVASMKF